MSLSRDLRFHWSLSQAGDPFRRSGAPTAMSGLSRFEAQVELCRLAEQRGIDSMLMAFGFTRPDPLLLSVALGLETASIKFMVACRPGLMSPTLFVQEINSLSAVTGGRVHINIVTGQMPHELGYYGDTLDHDARYDRADEFLDICRRFWEGRGDVDFSGTYYRIRQGRLNSRFVSPEADGPEIYLGGSSHGAAELAAKHASCLWRLAKAPDEFAQDARPALAAGKELGLLVGLIARPTREEALAAAEDLIAPFGEETREVHRAFRRATDSVGFRGAYDRAESSRDLWEGRVLWFGAVPFLGAPSAALVGSADEVADALLEYRRVGVTQFLFMGWPDTQEMDFFGREVLPRVRERAALENAELSHGGPLR
jgi:alkanesulfonate monooxygenase